MGRFSETVMDHFMEPRNRGVLDDADAVGVSGSPGNGPYLIVYLKFRGRNVSDVRFQCHECGATVASGSMLTELIADSSIGACQALTADQLAETLGGLPPDKLHCAGMAIHALQSALKSLDVNTPRENHQLSPEVRSLGEL